MPIVSLNKLTNTESKESERPLSFVDWRKNKKSVSVQEAERQYSDYLKKFEEQKTKKSIESVNKLKDDYTNLLKRLQVIFEDDEEFKRYRDIDLDSTTDLSIAIPLYARKLKEIALLYVNKRQEIKNKKIEYNLVGSGGGLEKLFYSMISSKFTKSDKIKISNESPLITDFPEFSSINKDFDIEISELYDTTNYYDEQLNPFACLFNDICYNLVSTPLSSRADPLENLYLCEPEDATVDQLLQQAYQKYISTDVSFVSGGYYIENYRDLTLDIQDGNNFFYWFSGKTVYEIPEGIYDDLPVNSFEWTNATGGSASDISDLMFVNVGNVETKAAWLKEVEFEETAATMSATMIDGKTFKFPFPDFGSSSVGGEWSGPGLDDTQPKEKKFFPTEEDFTRTETRINQTYWNAFDTISTVRPIYLQETTLGENGIANNNFNSSDKIYVNEEFANTNISYETKEGAWLYDFRQTQIPITQGENQIYFPLQRFDVEDELFYNYNKDISVALSSLDVGECFAGSVAGLELSSSDVIIKNRTVCGSEIEAAWLQAKPLRYFTNFDKGDCACNPDEQTYFTGWAYTSGGIQTSLSFRCEANDFVRFIWTGETTEINRVRGFTGFDHDDTCPYKQEDHSVSLADKNFLNTANKELFEKWKNCECQAIQHSPFGHNQDNVEHFKITPDIIVRDSSYPDVFNFKSWRGRDGNDYTQSADAARFYPTNLIETDLGWGKGLWRNMEGDSFVLEKGQAYIYYRATNNSCEFESPYFVINEEYGDGTVADDDCERVSYHPEWRKATLNAQGEWIDTGEASDMVLEFGDFLNYIHRQTYTEEQKKMLYNGVEIDTLSGEFVTIKNDLSSNIDYLTFENTHDSVNFLIKIPLPETTYWGKFSYNDGTTTSQTNGKDVRIVYDYLQITQPELSQIVLSDRNIIEYKFGNENSSCFVWEQPLNFDVYAPSKKWKILNTEECVSTEILSYLNSQITNCYNRVNNCWSDCDNLDGCGPEQFCNPTKTGITATNVDSDIVFNTELSGIPVFVNYFARNDFQQDVQVKDVTFGDKSLFVPLVSGKYVTPETPWRDLLNQEGSNFVIEENINNLQTKEDLNFYHPTMMGMGRFETFNDSETLTVNSSGLNIFRENNYFDKPFSQNYKDSKYITDLSQSGFEENIVCPVRQTFVPYTNKNEKYNKKFNGLYSDPLSYSPWESCGVWKDEDTWKNIKGQYNIDCENDWYSNQLNLSSNVWDWQTDVFGNEYYVTNDDLTTHSSNPTSYNTVYVKMIGGEVFPMDIALSATLSSVLVITPDLSLSACPYGEGEAAMVGDIQVIDEDMLSLLFS